MFLTLEDGDYTINVNHITLIDWTDGDECATVTLACGEQVTFEGVDYHALKAAIGLE